MRRRAMYRWKSFWLGMLMLCFLGWAWVRSMRQGERIGVVGRDVDTSCVMVVEGKVIVSTQFVRDDVPFQWERVRWPAVQYAGSYPVWAYREWNESLKLMRWVVFPMWAAVAVVLAVWGSWLSWRWWRVRRVAGLSTADEG